MEKSSHSHQSETSSHKNSSKKTGQLRAPLPVAHPAAEGATLLFSREPAEKEAKGLGLLATETSRREQEPRPEPKVPELPRQRTSSQAEYAAFQHTEEMHRQQHEADEQKSSEDKKDSKKSPAAKHPAQPVEKTTTEQRPPLTPLEALIAQHKQEQLTNEPAVAVDNEQFSLEGSVVGAEYETEAAPGQPQPTEYEPAAAGGGQQPPRGPEFPGANSYGEEEPGGSSESGQGNEEDEQTQSMNFPFTPAASRVPQNPNIEPTPNVSQPQPENVQPQWYANPNTAQATPNQASQAPETVYVTDRSGENRALVTGLLAGGAIEHFRHKRREKKERKAYEKQMSALHKEQDVLSQQLEQHQEVARTGAQQLSEKLSRSEVRQGEGERKNTVQQSKLEQLLAQEKLTSAEYQQSPEADTPEQVEIPDDRKVETSSWHRIEIDKNTGKVAETPTLAYGSEFEHEQQQEHVGKYQDLRDKPSQAQQPANTAAAFGSAAATAQTQTSSGGNSSASAGVVSNGASSELPTPAAVDRPDPLLLPEYSTPDSPAVPVGMWIVLGIVVFTIILLLF